MNTSATQTGQKSENINYVTVIMIILWLLCLLLIGDKEFSTPEQSQLTMLQRHPMLLSFLSAGIALKLFGTGIVNIIEKRNKHGIVNTLLFALFFTGASILIFMGYLN